MDVPVNTETYKLYWNPFSYPKNHDGSYSRWNSTVAPILPEGIPMWTDESQVYWVKNRSIYFAYGYAKLKLKDYVFINEWTSKLFFDTFSAPEGIEFIDLYDSPTYVNEDNEVVHYW
jgi:hypothetical protein